VQDVDCPAHVQALAQPARDRGPRVQVESLRFVPLSKDLHRIVRHLGRRRDLRQKPAVRPAEPKLAVRFSIELIALFMDSAVVAATQKGEIRKRRRAALGPVMDVVTLSEANSAAREAAAAVSVVERPP
jgi:hypothetical protein